jgi:Tfp pilus assembly protein PilF
MNTRLEKLKEMEKQKPSDAFVKFAIAQEYVGMNDDITALSHFKSLLETQPGYVPLYFQLGKLYERNEDLKSADDIYSKGITVAKAANDLKTAGELNEALILLEDE